MWRNHWAVLSAVLAIGMIGCGTSPEQTKTVAGPETAVAEFLQAVRSGNDAKTSQMLTTAARETTAALGMPLTPSGSDTAEFKVGAVEYVGEDGARVACTLSDLDENLQRQSQELVWMVRREAEGWRIAGVAIPLGDGQPPRALNFESREDMAQLGGGAAATSPEPQAQTQGQPQTQPQAQAQPQTQPQAQVQVQPQTQPQAQRPENPPDSLRR